MGGGGDEGGGRVRESVELDRKGGRSGIFRERMSREGDGKVVRLRRGKRGRWSSGCDGGVVVALERVIFRERREKEEIGGGRVEVRRRGREVKRGRGGL